MKLQHGLGLVPVHDPPATHQAPGFLIFRLRIDTTSTAMPFKSLETVVFGALNKIGELKIHQTVPELRVVDLSDQSRLVSILLDNSAFVLREMALMEFLVAFPSKFRHPSHQQLRRHPSTSLNIDQDSSAWVESSISKASVRYASTWTSTGVLVGSMPITSVLPVSGRTIQAGPDQEKEGEEYIPLISLALGPFDGGPVKAAFNEIASSRMYRSKARSTLCTAFLDGLLDLWACILTVCITPEGARVRSRESNMDIDPPLAVQEPPSPPRQVPSRVANVSSVEGARPVPPSNARPRQEGTSNNSRDTSTASDQPVDRSTNRMQLDEEMERVLQFNEVGCDECMIHDTECILVNPCASTQPPTLSKEYEARVRSKIKSCANCRVRHYQCRWDDNRVRELAVDLLIQSRRPMRRAGSREALTAEEEAKVREQLDGERLRRKEGRPQ